MHKYTDAFVQRMREFGRREKGIELKTVSIWLAKKDHGNMATSQIFFELMKNQVDRLVCHGCIGRFGLQPRDASLAR